MAAIHLQKLQQLYERYRRPASSLRSAKRLAEAVDYLIGNPLFTVRGLQAGLRLGDFKTVQRYVDELEEAGILREVTGRKHNGLYRAGEVLDAIQAPVEF